MEVHEFVHPLVRSHSISASRTFDDAIRDKIHLAVLIKVPGGGAHATVLYNIDSPQTSLSSSFFNWITSTVNQQHPEYVMKNSTGTVHKKISIPCNRDDFFAWHIGYGFEFISP